MHVAGDVNLGRGALQFKECHAENQSRGGALHVKGSLRQWGGSCEASSCSATHGGGAIAVEGRLEVSGGSMSIWNASVGAGNGGAILASQGLVQRGGQLALEGGSAENGGCVAVTGNFTVSGGVFRARECEAEEEGGAVYVQRGMVEVLDGNVTMQNASATGNGGAIVAAEGLHQHSGQILLEGCTSYSSGGAVAVLGGDALISGGDFRLAECVAGVKGGCFYILTGLFQVSGGRMSIHDAHAYKQGGAISSEVGAQGVSVRGGSLTLERCRSDSNGGGIAVEWADGFQMSGGEFRCTQCTSGLLAGAILSMGYVKMLAGVAIIQDAYAGAFGGAIYSDLSFVQRGGRLTLRSCGATRGGGISIREGGFNISDGHFECESCTAEYFGGAVYVQNNIFEIGGGNVSIRNASAGESGGGIMAQNGALQRGGRLLLDDCHSDHAGGGLLVWTNGFNFTGGEFHSSRCSSGREGGAVSAGDGGFVVSGGSITIRNSRAETHGGAIASDEGFLQSGGRLVMEGCSADSYGGGLFLHGGHLKLVGGEFHSSGCTSGLHGGAIAVTDGSLFSNVTVNITNAKASDRGGAIYVNGHAHFQGGLSIGPASANQGGCLFVKRDMTVSGSSIFQSCTASGTGGALSVKGNLRLGNASFQNCSAPAASVFTVLYNASMDVVDIHGVTGAEARCGEALRVRFAQCAHAPSCRLEGQSVDTRGIACGRGQGFRHPVGVATCEVCNEELTRLTMHSPTCVRCPHVLGTTISCEPASLSVPEGFMVVLDLHRADDLSEWYRCPNKACPGGQLNASTEIGKPVQVVTPMCLKGYEGPGCASCAAGYARGDANVLQCVDCSQSYQARRYVAFYIVKTLALFVSAVASVAFSKGERAASATLLNQLMAFAAVASVAMSGAMQTKAFVSLQHETQDLLEYLSLPVAAAQGQGSGGQMSAECLLGLVGWEKSVHQAHMLMSIWPAVLVAGLAVIKGGWLAAVVGTNVFLPGFTAAFGKYLVAYRLRPEDSVGGELHWDFLPPGPAAAVRASVLAAVVACFALGAGSWLYVVQSRREPMQPHVAYLMQAYKTECSIWEIERLVRKMLLALVTAMLPVTLSPALQMEAVSLILTASVGLHFYFQPYKVDFFNNSEIALLVLALTMTGLTTCLVANDLHWARTMLTQQVMIFLICFLAAGVCLVMMLRFAFAFLAERRARAALKGLSGSGTGRNPAEGAVGRRNLP
ncbi:unnamed protein product [Symbiodinium natans]|uniref:Uncharacterized protein n=1 Tax=Symbiodinium natans TaxID=878477 RepID=A0A812KTR9_9DINO|nr:unnamed protein product [Symbiodinium natans]